ncbi:type II toxin-antitoxin system VapC family toxin [Pseudonocardia sp. NPDC049635]|uniref:type II toxin-antitoxin system VapC family toxin n=1 Tax=Pseudonocardia sp. NPDC049635 TaxID=3155506 RepID=UPI0033E310BB
MRLLLDSHVVLWWLAGDERLGTAATEAIADGGNDAVVSVATLWELAVKQSIGKLVIDGDLRDQFEVEGFDELPILGTHAAEVGVLPLHHRDPFDRMLVAQARVERLTLVTADLRLTAYDVDLLTAG